MKPRYGYVYLTTNNVNGKRYIGKRSKPEFDNKYLGSGKLLKRAIKKYGKDNFDCKVLEWCSSEEELNSTEKKYISRYDAQRRDDFYNISSGGDWGDITRGMSKDEYEAWKQKISPKGRRHSAETKQKMSDARKGIVFSDKTIEKMRYNNSGNRNPHYGRKQTEKHKKRIVEVFGKPVTAFLNDGTAIRFESVSECKQYFKENYNVSNHVVKKLLSSGTPLSLPEREKNRYPDVYALNGTTIMYEVK